MGSILQQRYVEAFSFLLKTAFPIAKHARAPHSPCHPRYSPNHISFFFFFFFFFVKYLQTNKQSSILTFKRTRQLQHRPTRFPRQLHRLEQKHSRRPTTIHRRPRLHRLRRHGILTPGRSSDGDQERHGGQCAKSWWRHAVGWI